MSEAEYGGGELALFAHASNWKRYFGKTLAPYIHGAVLEVGAGIGGTTPFLRTGAASSWVCLEPDPKLVAQMRQAFAGPSVDPGLEIMTGYLDDVPGARRFDSILYIDVLEHIEQDRAELERALGRLRPGGNVVVLCPAHPFLFSPFDAGLGHYRRYNRRMFRDLAPTGGRLTTLFYLDAAGMLLSLGNRLLLRQGLPTARQIAFWDRVCVPLSRFVDPLTLGLIGKSIVGVWTREAT